jgi:glycosyltransferase involved in cell wall biosynthesis
MPHLNSRPFIQERMESILRQTLEDWELIIVDSNSDDGSRPILEQYARNDRRIKLSQSPRDGIYTNLNRAIELATGKYVYVATSDDTMAPQCLERMVEALERNPDCGICHCCLEIVDDTGEPVGPADAWESFASQRYFGPWLNKHHVRRAPHDGLLHFGLFTVYTSLNQLLIRRSVFERRGLFRIDSGSHADFEWGMRVGLTENVVHLPQKLAQWRRHRLQATQLEQVLLARSQGEFHRLAIAALKSLRNGNRALADSLKDCKLHRFYLVNEIGTRRTLAHSTLDKASGIAGFAGKHPLFCIQWLYYKLVRRERIAGDFDAAVRDEFRRLGLTDLLREVTATKMSEANA